MLARTTRLAHALATAGTATTVAALAALALTGAGCGGDDSSGDDTSGNHATAIALTSLNGLGYTAPVSFGSQTFDGLMDTGSTTAGVAASTCSTCSVSPGYDSSGATDAHKTVSAQYGQGSWMGEVFSDKVAIGTGPSVAVSFASITEQQDFFNGGFDAIVGLGPDGLLSAGTTSYLTAATTDQVAFQLCSDTGATMWLGGYDDTHLAGDMQLSPMTTASYMGIQLPYYLVQVGSASLGGTDLGLTAADLGKSVVDTGTSISFVPSATVSAIANAVNANSAFQAAFPGQQVSDGACLSSSATAAELDAQLPKLGLTLAGAHEVQVPATSSYLFQEEAGQWCFAFSDASQLLPPDMSLLGNALMHDLVVLVDRANKQIGFAESTGCDAATSHRALPVIQHTHAGRPHWQDNPAVRVPRAAALRTLR